MAKQNGAEGGSRTHTTVRLPVFETGVYAIPPLRHKFQGTLRKTLITTLKKTFSRKVFFKSVWAQARLYLLAGGPKPKKPRHLFIPGRDPAPCSVPGGARHLFFAEAK